MLTKNHVKINFAATFAASCLLSTGLYSQTGIGLRRMIFNWFYPYESVSRGPFVFCFFAAFFLWLGSVLPDIDSENSRLGRKIHLPVGHRTWTHSMWALGLMLILAVLKVKLRFLFIGYGLHLAVDSVSPAGICFTYPFKKYIRYDNGAYIAPGHNIKLYRTGQKSEKRLTWLIVALCIVLWLIVPQTNNFFEYLFL